MDLLILGLLMVGIAAIDLPKMFSEHRNKEVKAYFLVWVPALIFVVLNVLDVPLPNPTVYIRSATRAFLGLFGGG